MTVSDIITANSVYKLPKVTIQLVTDQLCDDTLSVWRQETFPDVHITWLSMYLLGLLC